MALTANLYTSAVHVHDHLFRLDLVETAFALERGHADGHAVGLSRKYARKTPFALSHDHGAAPSPNSTQDARSFQSTSLDIASADTMSILSALPVEMRESASSMQYRTPTHAALTSNAGAAMPSFSATQNANEGVTVSPRMVAASTNPISEGEVFASSRAISCGTDGKIEQRFVGQNVPFPDARARIDPFVGRIEKFC